MNTDTPTFIPASKAQTLEQVTFVTEHRSVGVGRLHDGRLYVSGGNGFFYQADHTITRDGGAGYMAAVRTLMLPPAYANMTA